MNIHICETNNGSANVVFHVTTPTGYNSVGIPWTECVKNCALYKYIGSACMNQSDIAEMKDGRLIEIREKFTFSDPDLSDAQKKNEVEKRYIAVRDATVEEIKRTLKYYGYEDEVE